MTQEKLFDIFDKAKKAVEENDVQAMMETFSALKISAGYGSPLENYMSNIMVQTVKSHVTTSGKPLKVKRNGEYGTTVTDTYVLDGDTLKRNGCDAKWTSIGKLYQAYKQIKNIK